MDDGTAFPALPIATVDVEHYALDLELFPAEQRLEGACTIRLIADGDGPRRLDLDLNGLEVTQVLDEHARPLEFVHAEGRLSIAWERGTDPGQAITVQVHYAGSPAQGLWWVRDRADQTLVFTHGECEESSWWFPCNDVPHDRATSELRVTMPDTWTSVAAGEAVGASVKAGGRRTEHWRMSTPHAAYLTTLVAGQLESITQDWHGMPLTFHAPSAWAPYMAASLSETGAALDYFSDLLGTRYPYRKYAQACVPGFPFGGMENISATTLTVEALSDAAGLIDSRPDGLVAHEVAHQWIGDLVTVGDWSHVWIQEGLATYLTLMFTEHQNGTEEFQVGMRETRREYIIADRGAGRRAIVHDVYRSPSDLFAGGHAYQGGATRFHLLRSLLGEEGFRTALRMLIGHSAGQSIDTDDVRVAFERASGRDLGAFFDQWLLSPGHPEIETRWRYDPSRGQVILSVNQVQSIEGGTASAFKAPVQVEIMGANGSQVVRVELEKRRAKYELPCDGEPMWVRFDKQRWLPAEIRADKEPAEWLSILLLDDDVNGRFDALHALARMRSAVDAEVRVAIDQGFVQSLGSDPQAAVRSAAAGLLGRLGTPEARIALESAVNADAAVTVRQSALAALTAWGPDAALVQLAERTFEARASWGTMGAAASLRVAGAPDTSLEWVRERLGESSPNEILRRQLLRALGRIPTKEAGEELRRWLNDRKAFAEVRAEAGRQLVRRAAGADRAATAVRADLIALLDDEDGRLRRAILDGLGRVDHPDVHDALVAYHGRTVHARERRAIEAVLGARPGL
ncbi:MAG: aminopeptidase N [Chlamydiales bacterium]